MKFKILVSAAGYYLHCRVCMYKYMAGGFLTYGHIRIRFWIIMSMYLSKVCSS
jgi:hypothetical protein